MKEEGYSRLTLERIAVGEIEMPEEMAKDEVAARRIAELRDSNEEILRAYPAEVVSRRILDRLESRDDVRERRTPPRSAIRGLTLAAAALLVLFVGVVPRLLDRSGADGPIRLKGAAGPDIRIYRKVGTDAERLADRAKVREGDLLQIAYTSTEERFGAVLSLDGRGVVTVHYPYEGAEAGPIETGGEIALEYAYRLDDAPDFERFFLLTGSRPFDIEPAVAALEEAARTKAGGRTGEIELPEGIEQYSMILEKEQTR